jgi:hemoglobin/transferrin/lactoferrin receptor protein
MRHLKPQLCIVVLLALVLTATLVHAQSGTGVIRGTVTDQSGAVIGGAKVWLVHTQQATLRATVSDASGQFGFDAVPTGAYELRIEKKDFDRRRLAVQTNSGATANLDVVLEIAPISDQVTVTAEAGQVTDRRSIAQQVNIINEREILERAPEVVAQVVDEEPGVNLQRTSPSLSAVFVRGLTGRNVAVYVDGVRYTTSAQRGGVSTFFSLIEPSSLETVEILRGADSSQYGSDVLGGVVNFISRTPVYGNNGGEFHGNTNVFYTSPTNGFGGNTLLTYGTQRYGVLLNVNARRINRLRPADGLDSHAAVTRFFGIPSSVFGERLPDTAFTQYGGLLRANFNLNDTTQLLFSYARNQQDGGKRYDQLLGGDGNLIADLSNLKTDLFYARLIKQNLGFFNNGSFTFSYNGQREERINQGGQGDPNGAITSQRERTNVLGFNFYVDKQIGERNTALFGADVYRDKITAPAFAVNPVNGVTTLTRPRIPNGARYLSYGFFAQDVFTVVPERLRVSGALRYSVASYNSRAANAPLAGNGRPLFPDDSARFNAFSGRLGAVYNVGGGFDIAAKYTRGFRAPNTTDLGTIGLVGTGFEVDAATAANLGGFVGTTAGSNAVSSGIPIRRLEPERSDSFDLSFRFTRSPRFRAEITGFTNKLKDVFFDQALVLPQGAVGSFLGSERITSQNADGLVFVAAATSPVLVRTNFDNARFNGVEFSTEARLGRDFRTNGNFTYIRAHSLLNGLPPNIEGGVPPATGFFSLRYQPRGSSRFYVEAYSTLAARQTRLSSLDLSDRRTGAPRTRGQIANFFNRGARVRGLISNGADNRPNTADDILIPTNETLAQVQNRLLPIGATINGVTVTGNGSAVPLFTAVPGYGLIGVRGAFRFNESSEIFVDFENIADKFYRGISWGIDGAGRGVTVRYRFRF